MESATRPTTEKLRVIAGQQQMLRIDDEATGPLSEADEAGLLAALDAALTAGPDAIIVSDYGKGVCTPAVLARLRGGAPVLVDPKGADFSRYAGAACITCGPAMSKNTISSVRSCTVRNSRNHWASQIITCGFKSSGTMFA